MFNFKDKKQTLFKYEHNIVTNVPLNMVEKISEDCPEIAPKIKRKPRGIAKKRHFSGFI